MSEQVTDQQPNIIQSVYIFLSKWFSTNFISMMIGVMTSAVVNILTGEKQLSIFFGFTVLNYFLLCCVLYQLLLSRQKLDENEAPRKKVQLDAQLRWKNSCNWRDKRTVWYFYIYFVLALGMLVGGIYLNVKANHDEIQRDKVGSGRNDSNKCLDYYHSAPIKKFGSV